MNEPTLEMVSLFHRRTFRHIEQVRENLLSLIGFHGLDQEALEERAADHDRSKFSESERSGYVWLNWSYHCRKQGIAFEPTPEIRDVIQKASAEHRSRNLHHPEAHGTVSQMRTLDIVEMICDWHAIAQENGTGHGSTAKWLREEGIKRWRFTESQLELARETITELEKRTG